MPEIPSEETIYRCADALYSVLAEAVQQRDVRQRLLKALDNHDLAETPYGECQKVWGGTVDLCG